MQNQLPNKPLGGSSISGASKRSIVPPAAAMPQQHVKVPYLRAATGLLLCAITGAGFTLGSTGAFFSDAEKTTLNTFIADPLAFSVTPEDGRIDLSQGDVQFTSTVTPDEGSDAIQYFIQAAQTGGDPALCQAVRVYATAPAPFDGALLSLISPTSTQMGPWTLHFYLTSDAPAFNNTSCTTDLTYKGFNADAEPGQGYADTHAVSLTFFIPAKAEASALAAVIEDTDVASDTPQEEIETPEAASTTPPAIEPEATTTTPVAETPEPAVIESAPPTEATTSDATL